MYGSLPLHCSFNFNFGIQTNALLQGAILPLTAHFISLLPESPTIKEKVCQVTMNIYTISLSHTYVLAIYDIKRRLQKVNRRKTGNWTHNGAQDRKNTVTNKVILEPRWH